MHRNRSNNRPIVSVIHNGSEITTWMGYSFKSKSTKSKTTFLRQRISFLNLKLQIIRLAQGHWRGTTTHYNNCFYSIIFTTAPMKKHILQLILPKNVFLSIFWQKSRGFNAKYYLLAGDSSQVFFPNKIKMNKQHRFIL